MASLLSMGAGASEGLETLLNRLMTEQKQRELERSNRADEDYRNRALAESSALREMQAADLARTRQANMDNQTRDDIRANIATLPGGTKLEPTSVGDWLRRGAIPPERVDVQAAPDREAQNLGVPPALAPNDPTAEDYFLKPSSQELLAKARIEDGGGRINSEKYRLNGKDIIAQETPEGRIIYQGKDVTDQVDPYVSPDRTLVATSGGIVPRSEAAAAAAGGTPLQPPVTSATRTMMEGAGMLRPHIQSLAAQAEALDKNGLFGLMMSRVRDLATRLGTVQGLGSNDPDAQQRAMEALGDAIQSDPQLANDRLAGKFAASLGLLMTGAGRVHGGARGGGSPQMLEHFKHLLGSSASLPMFLGRLDALNEYMETYAGGPSPSTGAGDPYLEFLKKFPQK